MLTSGSGARTLQLFGALWLVCIVCLVSFHSEEAKQTVLFIGLFGTGLGLVSIVRARDGERPAHPPGNDWSPRSTALAVLLMWAAMTVAMMFVLDSHAARQGAVIGASTFTVGSIVQMVRHRRRGDRAS